MFCKVKTLTIVSHFIANFVNISKDMPHTELDATLFFYTRTKNPNLKLLHLKCKKNDVQLSLFWPKQCANYKLQIALF